MPFILSGEASFSGLDFVSRHQLHRRSLYGFRLCRSFPAASGLSMRHRAACWLFDPSTRSRYTWFRFRRTYCRCLGGLCGTGRNRTDASQSALSEWATTPRCPIYVPCGISPGQRHREPPTVPRSRYLRAAAYIPGKGEPCANAQGGERGGIRTRFLRPC